MQLYVIIRDVAPASRAPIHHGAKGVIREYSPGGIGDEYLGPLLSDDSRLPGVHPPAPGMSYEPAKKTAEREAPGPGSAREILKQGHLDNELEQFYSDGPKRRLPSATEELTTDNRLLDAIPELGPLGVNRVNGILRLLQHRRVEDVGVLSMQLVQDGALLLKLLVHILN